MKCLESLEKRTGDVYSVPIAETIYIKEMIYLPVCPFIDVININ